MIGDIMTISRLRMGTDGDGVTTLVTLFGCPLMCRYCINDYCHDNKGMLDATARGAYKPEELVDKLSKDDIYYLMTNGGVTFGGGEPLLQADFIKDVCIIANPKWNFRIETSLYVEWQNIEKLIEYVDEWIIDIKDINTEIYKKYTGKSNAKVLKNLEKLLKCVSPDKIRVRVPYIYGYNDNQDINHTVDYLKKMGITRIERFEYIVT